METPSHVLAYLSDSDLITEVKRLAASECRATASLIASLAELDRRRLYLAAGYSSLFTYCTQALGLSEAAAYFRIEAARAAQRFPLILERLAEGAITLSTVKLLAHHFTADNHCALLDQARGQSKRAVEEMLARLCAQPDAPSVLRKLPSPKTTALPRSAERAAIANDRSADLAAPQTASTSTSVASEPCAERCVPTLPAILQLVEVSSSGEVVAPKRVTESPRNRGVVAPLAPGRYKLQMTVSAETHAKLLRARDLLRHVNPDGDLATVFDRALTVLVDRLERVKLGTTSGGRRTRAPSRERKGPATKKCRSGPGAAMLAASEEKPNTKAAGATLATGMSAVASASRTAEGGAPSNNATSQPVLERAGAKSRGRVRSRYIPAAVRRAVAERDGNRCTFVGTSGIRCSETGFLEFHHAVP